MMIWIGGTPTNSTPGVGSPTSHAARCDPKVDPIWHRNRGALDHARHTTTWQWQDRRAAVCTAKDRQPAPLVNRAVSPRKSAWHISAYVQDRAASARSTSSTAERGARPVTRLPAQFGCRPREQAVNKDASRDMAEGHARSLTNSWVLMGINERSDMLAGLLAF